MEAKVIVLSGKDAAIMKGLQSLHMMEEKLAPLLQVADLMKTGLALLVFGEANEGEHTIILDENHSAVFKLVNGELEYDMVCNCAHDEGEHAPHNSVDMHPANVS
jgi:hypothetical protein